MKSREVTFVVVTVLVLSCLTIAADKKRDLYPEYETFSRIVASITANYAEEVDTQKLFYGAYDGMLQTLDPYSAFLPPQEKEDLEVETRGEFGGLGIEITLDKNGILTVITPLEGTPAFNAGVLAGDKIIKIEGKSTKGLSLREAVKKLRGPKGKPVTITVFHEDGKIEDITVVRDIIKLESVKDPGFVDEKHKIAYIRLTQFQKNSIESLDKAVADLRNKGMQALVLDLRYNPGGLLRSAIEIADRFLEKGVIVSTKGRKSRERVYRAARQGTYPDFPLALLISGRSASASEIVAGAIQDHKRGVLVGTRTFGKASVQTLIPLQAGKSAIRLTTAYYYTPSGRLIHHNFNNPDQKTWGIEPDIEVKVTPQEEVALWSHWREKHLREVRERNGGLRKKAPPKEEGNPDKKGKEPEKKAPPKPGPEKIGPPAEKPPGTDDKDKKPAEFHDKTLEAAVNALKGMLIAQERAAAAAHNAAK